MNANLAARLSASARQHADRPCLIEPRGHTYSYADMELWAGRMAARLTDLGVTPGDRVLVQVEKSPANVALYLGTLRCGGVYVPLNSGYTGAEVEYFVGDAEPAVLVCDPARADQLARIAVDTRLATLDADGNGTLTAGLDDVDPLVDSVPRADTDLAAIVYTSGTTGRSKGAMLSHANLTSNALMLLDYWGWQDDDVLLHALPIFHVHGLFVAMHCAMLTATPMLWLPKFDAHSVAQLLPQATVLMGVPTFYTRLLDTPAFTRAACAGMRLFISGSAPLTEATFRAFEAHTGQRILERYGMSETGMLTSNPLHGERVGGTVGFPLPGVEVRIAAEDGRPVPTGEVGGIEVRGPNVFAGYWRMPHKTAEEFRDDGFFRTGDLGVMDADGRVSIVGRAKDLVISGGYNIYPKEIEGHIDRLPGIIESAVIGVPHRDFGEGLVAVVVAEGEIDEAQVIAALAGQLARFKQPKRVVQVDALPRNTMGKVQKNVLRERFRDLFG